MSKKVIFSGIQPSGNLHIGNYIGAIQQWAELQNDADNELIFCAVDLHAITVPQDPKQLREKNLELAALYIACGIDPKKSKIFIQSENPDHPYMGWLFDCVTPLGWLNRMTQFKDKSAKQAENTTVGLFNYPPLMAADILLYDATHVPVGEDQKQHIELTRDIADKMNRTFGDGLFVLPEPMISNDPSRRVMSLQNPAAKMSKSEKDPGGTVNLLSDEQTILDVFKRAVTDSDSEIRSGEDKPALTNLLAIYSKISGKTVSELETQYKGVGYGQFKEELGQTVATRLGEIRKRYSDLRSQISDLNNILDEGREFARERSGKKVAQVRDAMGLGR
jgi:tryptophanyl-tRNA synthetase